MRYLIIGLLFLTSVCFADEVSKVDDTTLKITKEVEQVITLKNLKRKKVNLGLDIEKFQRKIIRLQEQITRITQQIQEAEELGIKEDPGDGA